MAAFTLGIVFVGILIHLRLEKQREIARKTALVQQKRRVKRQHRFWRRPWLGNRFFAENNTLYKFAMRLVDIDPEEFFSMLRMTPEVFFMILDRVRPHITKKDSNFRPAITAEEKLVATLRYLATGDDWSSSKYANKISKTSVRRAVYETCDAIIKELQGEYVKTPRTKRDWLAIERQYRQRWNYPGCLGAVDGKHVEIMKPPKSGSTFFNYKLYFSIVLLVVANANYEIIYAETGSEGRPSDGGIWSRSPFFKAVANSKLEIPDYVQLEGWEDKDNNKVSLHFIGDDAFALSSRMNKPYAIRAMTEKEATHNYRLSRARRVVENVFGIMCARFHVLRKSLNVSVENASRIVQTTCVLHNLLRLHCGRKYMPHSYVDHEDHNSELIEGGWRAEARQLDTMIKSKSRNASQASKEQRDLLASYFVSEEGSLSFQRRQIKIQHSDFMPNLPQFGIGEE